MAVYLHSTTCLTDIRVRGAEMVQEVLEEWGSSGDHQAALSKLVRSYCYAQDLQASPWTFSVSGTDLVAMGLSENDLQWLEARGFVDTETAEGISPARRKGIGARPSLIEVRVILTSQGMQFATQVASSKSVNRLRKSGKREVMLPIWDSESRLLSFGDAVIKQFKRSAAAQELILQTFEGLGWPAVIDDPLPYTSSNAKQRLHHTVNNLNRNHKNSLIRFFRNGTGTGIRWEKV